MPNSQSYRTLIFLEKTVFLKYCSEHVKCRFDNFLKKKVHHKPKSFSTISTINRRKILKNWFLSNSSSRHLYCSFDNPTKYFHSLNVWRRLIKGTSSKNVLPRNVTPERKNAVLLQHGLQDFNNNLKDKFWKFTVGEKSFSKNLICIRFSFKTATMQFWQPGQKVYTESLNFSA